MKSALLLLTIFLITCEGIKNYAGTDLRKCFNCLCHARTGCFSRYNCASYSINMDYWQTARSPVVDVNDEPEAEASYRRCMRNENCILTTLDQYADEIGHMDCNCDGQFDCKDRFAIHLFGKSCSNPVFNKTYADRFNRCSKDLGVGLMLPEEGYEGCSPEIF